METEQASPAYKRLASELRDEIMSGAFPPSRRLPTEAELRTSRGLSRQTVRQAYNELASEGLIYRVRGRGTFAAGAPAGEKYLRSLGSVEDLLALATDSCLEVLSPLERQVDVEAASRLRLDSDEVLGGLFRRLHKKLPFCASRVYLPRELGEIIADDPRIAKVGAITPVTVIGLIDELTGTSICGVHQSITAAPVPADVAGLIDSELGAPALRIDRLYFEKSGSMIELAVSYFKPARYSYRLTLRRRVS